MGWLYNIIVWFTRAGARVLDWLELLAKWVDGFFQWILPFLGFKTSGGPVVSPPPGPRRGRIKGPGKAALTARAYIVLHNAAIDLFAYYDLLLIPSQYWPILKRTRDPVEAFRSLLKSFGCDPELVRNHDAGEISKTQRMLSALSTLEGYDEFLSPQGRANLRDLFLSEDYDAAVSAAEILKRAKTIWETVDAGRRRRTFAVFKAFLDEVAQAAADPVNTSLAEMDDALALMELYRDIQVRAETLEQAYETAMDRLEVADIPPEWSHNGQAAQLDAANTAYAHVMHEMYDDAGLGVDALEALLADCEVAAKQIEALAAEAEQYTRDRAHHRDGTSGGHGDKGSTGSGHSKTGSKPHRGARYTDPDELWTKWSGGMISPDDARLFYGFEPGSILEKSTLKKRRKEHARQWHTDTLRDHSETEHEEAEQKLKYSNACYEVLAPLAV
ncbi:MAG: hypothetical protein V3V03_08530 [Hyphomonadaceae bacterium]